MASLLFLHIGQCGNQVGFEFWNLLAHQLPAQSSSAAPFASHASQFFDQNQFPNAILIDTEPKVINSILEQNEKKTHRDTRNTHTTLQFRDCLVEQSGCGNNWALGFQNSGTYIAHHVEMKKSALALPELDDLSLVDRALNACEKRIQSMDTLDSIWITASLSGGTGSGVGSRLVQRLRDTNGPSVPIVVCAVAAFMEGDTTLQYYNTMLSLAHFQKHADLVLLFHNSQIIKMLNVKRATSSHAVSTKDINQYIAACLVGLMMPYRVPQSNSSTSNRSTFKYFSAHQLIAQLAPMYPLNILELHTSTLLMKTAQQMTSWQYIAENFARSVPHFDLNQRQINQITMSVMVRSSSSISTSDRKLLQSILNKNFKRCQSWFHKPIPDTYHYTFAPHNKGIPSLKIDNAITVVLNRSSIMEYLNLILTKVHLMLNAGAYVNHYERFGCSRDVFEQCFQQLQFTIEQYAEYCREK